jgi:hypothetical protein
LIENIVKAISEVGESASKLLPDFAKDLKPEKVKSFKEANKSYSEVKTTKEIEEISEFSSEVNENIRSVDELNIYQGEGLKETEVNGKKCLIQENINPKQIDEYGRTNLERMKQGLSPLNEEGKTIELHHIGQGSDAPLAELDGDTHRGSENYSTLHEIQESDINRNEFKSERANYWKARAQKMEANL